ncbi:acetyl-CoA hydrolase/transferase C-terminal domain-containing protein [Solilutibacter silvestris]|uniref:acetyl-CoA hydrolase/transferase C-terminal domain-containing protein n=1 Tax=Solilutibacter silvestris TaxID=1645665 RepID=UPI003D34B1AF
MTEHVDSIEVAVARLLAHADGPLRVGAPLGLGKPHRLLNALYDAVSARPERELHLYTALSLDPPTGRSDLERRFLDPFVRRIYGDDFPRLKYVRAEKANALPANIEIEEFYLQSGALLDSTPGQRRYASLNYTHVADALADRAVNAIVQSVAANDAGALSFSCNTDLTSDTVAAIVARGLPRPLLVAMVDPGLPWLGGGAEVPTGFFDVVVTPPGPASKLFVLPREPVSDAEHAIGLYASTLVRDGGTLQIGIGALSDALCHALVLRHVDNARYRAVLRALDPEIERHPAVIASGGLDPLPNGLFGCSEMINEGFRLLVERGVLSRKVVDDLPLMQRIAEGSADASDRERRDREGQFLRGAFYLGSPDFYDWLRGLDEAERRAIDMRPVSHTNQLRRGHEALDRLQRHDARFFNTCMMATALGAAVSDGLDDGRVVSGVGGQYNFVAMGHDLDGARSALLLHATRSTRGHAHSNILWNYPHATIARHLRDLYVTEYGIADLRGKVDEDCIIAMTGIADARHQADLLQQARANRKLAGAFVAPPSWQDNTPERVRAALAPFRLDGTLPDYPLGSDFTSVEQRLVKALQWLQETTSTPYGTAKAIVRALASGAPADAEAMQRMALDAPRGLQDRLYARLLGYALKASAQPR